MKWFVRLQLWFRRWRRRRAFRKQNGELREFVYLDEVSVYSLIASRLGPIAAEFTETQTKTLEREISGSVGVDSTAVKVNWGPRRLDVQSQSSQVLRKSTVQTTFKEFYELEIDSLRIRPLSENEKPPEIHSLSDLIEASRTNEYDRWIADPKKLARGQLFELEVKLETAPIFHISAMISTFLEIFEETRQVLESSSFDTIEIREIDRILTKLLVGLVPLQGEAIDYKIVVIEDKEWIVHEQLLKGISVTDLHVYPLFVAGVAEQALFWRDIPRILFSNARFRVFCRIAENGLQDSWTPVKVAQVLETMMPGFANEVNSIGESAFAAMINIRSSNQTVEKQQRMRNALVGYADLLAKHYNLDMTPQDSHEIAQISHVHCGSYLSQKDRYEAFEKISDYLLSRFELDRQPDEFGRYREIALDHAGIDFSGQVI